MGRVGDTMTNNTPVNNGMLAQTWINVVKKCRAQAADEDAAFIIETAIDDLMHMVHERTNFDARTLDDMCDRMSEEIERAERLQQANFKLASDNARLAADNERLESELTAISREFEQMRADVQTRAIEIEFANIEHEELKQQIRGLEREIGVWEQSHHKLNVRANDQAMIIINERVNNEQLKQKIDLLVSELAHVQELNSVLDADGDLYRDLYAEVRAEKAYSEDASKDFARALLLIAALETDNPHMTTIAELATAELERLS